MATTEFKNMLGYDQTWSLKINPQSKIVEGLLSEVWNFVIDYFEKNKNKENIDNYIVNIWSELSRANYLGTYDKCCEILTNITNLKYEEVLSKIIEGEDTEEESFAYITFMIIYLRYFPRLLQPLIEESVLFCYLNILQEE